MERGTYIYGANEVFITHKDICQAVTEQNGGDPRANKSLNRLFRGKFDEQRAPKSYAADIGKDIIGYHERGGKDEPDHALENVVHYEMSLDDDQIQSHVRPGELGKLEAIMAFRERANKEDEACRSISIMKAGVFPFWKMEWGLLTHDI